MVTKDEIQNDMIGYYQSIDLPMYNVNHQQITYSHVIL